MEVFRALDADIFCLQETKVQEGQIEMELPGYEQYWHYAERKGYSGTAVFSRVPALSVQRGLEGSELDHEGRVITLELPEFYLVTCYTPNSQDGLKRLPFRMEWEDAFRAHLKELEEKGKPVIVCGDLNVAHEEIDIKNPKANRMNAGFSDEEREKLTVLLKSGFKDTFRELHPDTVKYSWWSYRFNARANNAGWRIDYFLVSDPLMSRVKGAELHNGIMGSDHCPAELVLE